MGESELIGACQQHLRNAELHHRSNNPQKYAASMSSVLELLTKELVGDAPPAPEPDADRQPSGSEQLPTEPVLPTEPDRENAD